MTDVCVSGAVLYVGLLTPVFFRFQDVVSQSEVTEQVSRTFAGMIDT